MSTGNNKKKLFDRDIIIEALALELKRNYELKESSNVEEFKNSKEGQFFIKKKSITGHICFFEHYEPEADILINDCLLNALGMVYVFCEAGIRGESSDACSNFLKDCIDKACYLRHLFLVNAENEINSGNDKIQARTVELIVVSPHDLKTVFGKTLREIAQKTDYLYSIGVNLLTISDPGNQGPVEENRDKKYFNDTDTNLDRAFSWLLPKTRKWYNPPSASDGASPDNNGARLQKITLNNFRLPGKRILTLEPKKTIHLVYGHNGSGKSTIVEALEMAVTGRSEHIEDTPDYDKVIRNKDSNNCAGVVIKREGKEDYEFDVVKTGIYEEPLDVELKATSFRLNQKVMALLTGTDNGWRANIFIDAFFPKDRKIVEDHNDCRAKAGKYFEKLPQDLRDSIIDKGQNRTTAVIDTLAVLADEKVEKPDELVEACLPIPSKSLRCLESFCPGLSGPLEYLKQGKINGKVLMQIDDALEPVFSDIESIITGLLDALDILKKLNKWQVPHNAAVDFLPTMDKLLEMTSWTDILEKYHVVVKSLKDSGVKPWNIDEDMAQIFDRSLLAVDDEMIMKKIESLSSERDRYRTLLEPASPRENETEEGVPAAVQPVLTLRETGCLNRLGKWMPYPGLGDKINEAIKENKILSFVESLPIGGKDWDARLIEKTNDFLKVCNELKAVIDREKKPGKTGESLEEPGKSCIGRFRYLHNTLQTYQDLKDLDEEVNDTFIQLLKKDGKLIPVLNEMINLFTPSRWAYRDISLDHEISEKKHELHLMMGEPDPGAVEKARADFRLNTAELNIFALSLFTLCAVRNQNPLSLLIYDDPLQNMDEITVTTIARGFNKLAKIFPGNWQIMMLFHGREDLERFCREIPAPVYFLPWLSPSSEAEEKKIEPETLTGQVFAGTQDFSNIVSTS